MRFDAKAEHPGVIDLHDLPILNKAYIKAYITPATEVHHIGEYAGRIVEYTDKTGKASAVFCDLFSDTEQNYAAAYAALVMKTVWDAKVNEIVESVALVKERLKAAESILKCVTSAENPYKEGTSEYEVWQQGYTHKPCTRFKPHLFAIWKEAREEGYRNFMRLSAAIEAAALYRKEFKL